MRGHEDATDLGQAKWRKGPRPFWKRVKRLENLGYSLKAPRPGPFDGSHASPGYCSPLRCSTTA